MMKPSSNRIPIFAAITLSAVLSNACSTTAPRISTDTPEYAPLEIVTDTPDLYYIVKRGDLLATIANKLTGSSSNWTIIAEANGITDPRRLRIGQQIVVPGYLLPPNSADGQSSASATVALRSVDTTKRATADDIGPDLAKVEVKKADPNRRFVLRPLGEASRDETREINGDEYIKVIGTYFPKVVYSAPELDAKLLLRVAPGTRLPLEKLVDGWYRVNTDRGIGFIRSEDGEPVSADG